MKVTVRTIAHLERVYSITLLPCAPGQTQPGFLAGSEEDDALLLFDAPDYQPKVIARSPGGYISIQPLIRDGRRHVVATTLFKPGFNGADAAIRLYPLDGDECPPGTLVGRHPYTHRLSLFQSGGREHLLISTLCAGKTEKEDWTQPGGVHLAVAPDDLTQPWPTRQIVHGLNKNHGMDFARLGRAGRPGWLLSAMEGLFFMPQPADPAADWALETISTEETSDACAFDWDGDGVPELFSISPFHGHVLAMHRCRAEGRWSKEIIHDDLSLGHIVWAGNLLGRPGLIAGSRRGRRELRLYRPAADGSVDPDYEILDTEIGVAQMAVVTEGDRRAALYLSAHGINEVRRYELEA